MQRGFGCFGGCKLRDNAVELLVDVVIGNENYEIDGEEDDED